MSFNLIAKRGTAVFNLFSVVASQALFASGIVVDTPYVKILALLGQIMI